MARRCSRRVGRRFRNRVQDCVIAVAAVVSVASAHAAVISNFLSFGAPWPLPNSGGPPTQTPGIDVDGDGVLDLYIELQYADVTIPEDPGNFRASAVAIDPASDPARVGMMTTAASVYPLTPAALPLGASIGPSESFSFDERSPLFRAVASPTNRATTVAPSNFPNATTFHQYLGIRLDAGSNPVYGWVQIWFDAPSLVNLLSDPNRNGVFVRNIAFDDSGQHILAGQIQDLYEGDMNRDGLVNSLDLDHWQTAYGASSDGDELATGRDFLAIQRQQGASALQQNPFVAAVPEPSTAVLAAAAIGLLASCQCRG